MATVRLLKRGTDWKDRMVGYGKYRVKGRCFVCGRPWTETVWGTAEECRGYAMTNRFLCRTCRKVLQ